MRNSQSDVPDAEVVANGDRNQSASKVEVRLLTLSFPPTWAAKDIQTHEPFVSKVLGARTTSGTLAAGNSESAFAS